MAAYVNEAPPNIGERADLVAEAAVALGWLLSWPFFGYACAGLHYR